MRISYPILFQFSAVFVFRVDLWHTWMLSTNYTEYQIVSTCFLPKSANEYPYFLIWYQCFLTEKNTRVRKYDSKKGQYTGMRKNEEYVQRREATSVSIIFFHRLNSVMERSTGRSDVLIVNGISNLQRFVPTWWLRSSSSGSGSPKGVKNCTSKYRMYRPKKYRIPT